MDGRRVKHRECTRIGYVVLKHGRLRRDDKIIIVKDTEYVYTLELRQ